MVKKVPPPEILLLRNEVSVISPPKTNGDLLELYLRTRTALETCNADKDSVKSFYAEESEDGR